MFYTVHLVGVCLTTVLSAAAAVWVFRRSRDRAGLVMTYLLVSHVVIAAAFAAQMASSTLASKIAWSYVWFPFSFLNVPVWFLFAAYYTGREDWLRPPVLAALGVIGILPAALVLSDPFHGLMIGEWGLATEPFVYLRGEMTPLGDFLLLLGLSVTFLSLGVLLRLVATAKRTSQLQSIALFFGLSAMVVPTAVELLGVSPLPGFPYGILGAGVFATVVSTALFRTRLFAVSPIARDALFDALEDGIVLVTPDRRLVDYNRRAGTLFELDGRVGDPLGSIAPALVEDGAATDGGRDADTAAAWGSDEGPFVDRFEVRSDGESRTFRVSVTEVRRSDRLRGYALSTRDVTELEAYATELQRKTEQQERLTSVLSHDLRNPLSVATGYTELANETYEGSELDRTLEALDRAEEMIDDLLTLTREGDPIPASELASVPLAGIVEKAWETSDTADATLEIELGPDWRIHAHESRLRTVLENVFRNAADHGGGGIRVTVGRTTGGFYVEDDGPGIESSERERVFEYGHSGGEGTGLGLAIVAEIVDAHGWAIDATESAAGGARFEITGVRSADGTGESPGLEAETDPSY